jgi:hypothetical protein
MCDDRCDRQAMLSDQRPELRRHDLDAGVADLRGRPNQFRGRHFAADEAPPRHRLFDLAH